MPLIEVEQVTHKYTEDASTRAFLDDVSPVAHRTPRVGVIGANGSGKSTFVRLLNGLIVPTHAPCASTVLTVATKPRQ